MASALTNIKFTTSLHRLHPLVKLIWLVGTTLTVFICSHPLIGVLIVIASLIGLWIAQRPPWRLGGRRLYLLLAVSLLTVNIWAFRQGDKIFGPITNVGLGRGVLAAGRILSVILVSQLFVITTDAASLGQSLIALGLPYRWSFALITALRLEPLFHYEANLIYWAQRVRGVRYDSGPLRRRWLMMSKLLLPLLVSILRTATTLSATMENRSFGLYRRRTSRRPLSFKTIDAVVLLSSLVVFAVLIIWNFYA